VLGTAVVVVVLAAAGCGGGGGGEAASPPTSVGPSPTSEPTSPSTAPTEEAAVLAAYQGYWDTWLAANDPPNPDHPDLERYATGAALAKVKESIADHRSVGQVLRLPERSISEHRSRVERLAGATAVVVDCSIDDGLVVAYGSDMVLDDSVVTWDYEVVMVNEGGWRVGELRVRDRSDGVVACAA